MMEAPKSIELSSTGGGGMGVLVGGRGWEGEWYLYLDPKLSGSF